MASAERRLRDAIGRYNATCDLVQAGRALVGRSDTDGALVEAARQAVVRQLDACEAAGLTEAELDRICADSAARTSSRNDEGPADAGPSSLRTRAQEQEVDQG